MLNLAIKNVYRLEACDTFSTIRIGFNPNLLAVLKKINKSNMIIKFGLIID